MRLKIQEMIGAIGWIEERGMLERDFPKEHLGVADRLLLNRCAVAAAAFAKKYHPKHQFQPNYAWVALTYKNMRGFGYTPREQA